MAVCTKFIPVVTIVLIVFHTVVKTATSAFHALVSGSFTLSHALVIKLHKLAQICLPISVLVKKIYKPAASAATAAIIAIIGLAAKTANNPDIAD